MEEMMILSNGISMKEKNRRIVLKKNRRKKIPREINGNECEYTCENLYPTLAPK